MRPVVLDTNVVLDLLVFADAAAAPLRDGLRHGRLQWLATTAMREEFERVLDYPKLAARMAFFGGDPGELLAAFDQQVRFVDVPTAAPVRCQDPDDQKFIDLAVAHRCLLLSKDAEVLRMRKRLAQLEVETAPALAALS
jgi:putative PIN family toxin of toxin-antitoxin system